MSRNGLKTHCPKGHPYDEANTYTYRGSRQCKACKQARRAQSASSNPQRFRAGSLSPRIAAHESWAATPDRSIRTAPARAAFLKRFEDQVDPDRVLSDVERTTRAEHARRAHFLRMAAKSAESRRAKKADGQ